MVAFCKHLVCCLAALAMALASAGSRADEVALEVIEASDAADDADCPPDLDVWVVSTRHLPGICSLPTAARFGIERLVGEPCCRRWERGELSELVGEPGRPLVIFAHGNRYTPRDAKAQGLALARRMAGHAGSGLGSRAAPRVVIFSWPSEQQGILLKDGRRKYERAYADGHYLAWLLCQVRPEQPVAIVGYSFGALVAAEAFDDLSRTSPDGIAWAERPGRTNLVFVTPALRCDAFAPRGPYRQAVRGLDGLTLLVNSRDEALKFFPLLEPAVRVDAMGYVGMARRWLPAEVEYKVTDTASVVGKLHTMWQYLDSRSLSGRIATGALTGMTE
jgi:hypothetical protein